MQSKVPYMHRTTESAWDFSGWSFHPHLVLTAWGLTEFPEWRLLNDLLKYDSPSARLYNIVNFILFWLEHVEFFAGLYTRTVLDAVMHSSKNGPWARVNIPVGEESEPRQTSQDAEEKGKAGDGERKEEAIMFWSQQTVFLSGFSFLRMMQFKNMKCINKICGRFVKASFDPLGLPLNPKVERNCQFITVVGQGKMYILSFFSCNCPWHQEKIQAIWYRPTRHALTLTSRDALITQLSTFHVCFHR